MKLPLLVLSIMLTAIACKDNKLAKVEADCGALITYEMTPEFARDIDKPEVSFSLQYPDGLVPKLPEKGKKSSSYGYFSKQDENERQVEMISLGYFSMTGGGNFKTSVVDYLDFVKGMFKSGGYELKNPTISEVTFDGEKYMAFQSEGTVDAPDGSFSGDYLLNTIVKQNPDPEQPHIMVLMAAEKNDTNIKNYEDFATKGCISSVWQTLAYK